MTKEAVVIEYKGKPIYVADIRVFKDSHDFVKFADQCKKNFDELLQEKEQDNKTLHNEIKYLNEKIYKLELENKLNRGEITKEEYDDVVARI